MFKVNSGESLTNWVKPLSLWVIRQNLHIDKIHKNDNSFLIIPTLSSKSYFGDIIGYFRSQRKENSSEIPAYGIYWSAIFFSPAN